MWNTSASARKHSSLCTGSGENHTDQAEDSRLVAQDPTVYPRIKRGYVYFIATQSERAVKIGWSTNIAKRLDILQSANPEKLRLVGVVQAGKAKEAEYHKRFGGHRIRGEWYRLPGPIRSFLKMLWDQKVARWEKQRGVDSP
jgi:hypothetical protein